MEGGADRSTRHLEDQIQIQTEKRECRWADEDDDERRGDGFVIGCLRTSTVMASRPSAMALTTSGDAPRLTRHFGIAGGEWVPGGE